MGKKKQDPHAWWRKAILVSVTGLVFSLAMSALMCIGAALRIAPLMALERAGVDFAMKTYVAFAPWVDPAFDGEQVQSYVFVDVDLEACRQFSASGREACLRDKPIPQALIMDFARAAKATGARVVMIDVAPPEAPSDRALLYEALSSDAGPWFIAPVPSRPNYSEDGIDLTIDWQSQEPPMLARGRLRLAPIVTNTDHNAGDGVVRQYPILARVRGANGARSKWLPTAPYLAAVLSDPVQALAADCLFYRAGAVDCLSSSHPAKLVTAVALGQDRSARNRILYSLPGLSELSGQSEALFRQRYIGRYERFVASRMVVDGRFDFPDELLRNKVVVLGTSAAQGGDWHPTPIGALTGSEIVLNAARAFREFSPLRETTEESSSAARTGEAWSRFTAKFGGTLLGALMMTPAWLAIYWLISHPRLPRPLSRLAAAGVFVLFMAAIIIVEVISGIGAMKQGARIGQITDLLTPVLALGLEGYAEVAKAFTDLAERSVLAVFRIAARLLPKQE